jgi:hypothetical protein
MKCHDDETCKHGCHDDVRCEECDAEALDRAVEMEIERKRERRESYTRRDIGNPGGEMIPPVQRKIEAVSEYDVTLFYHCNYPEDS